MGSYNLGEARGKIVLETDFSSLEEGQKFLDGYKRSAEQNASSQQEAWKKTGTAATVAGASVVAGFGVAVKAATDFEFQLSAIQAVSGSTADEMDLIRAAALRIGQDTSYSASEAAQAMEELVKAGISTQDVLNGAADATVALAAAGGVDLPTAATIASNAMNQFQLKAQDLVGVTDLIAGAANASAIDVGQFGMSLSQVGAVANLAGLSFDDTAVAIAAMGNAGIVGSDAGTSLKTMLMNLQPTTDAAAEAMRSLGIITEDGTNQFYDAQGGLKSLADISGILQGALSGMSEAQKQATLQVLFGSDAIRGAAVLAQEGAAGINELNDAMLATSAADTAATRMDNMKGSAEALSGSVETLMIGIGTQLIPRVREMVDGMTEAVNWFSALDQGTQDALVGTASFTGGALLAVGATIKMVGAVQSAVSTVKALELGAKASAAAEKAKAVAMGISAAATRAAQIATMTYTEIQKGAAVAVWLMKPANAAAAASMVGMKAAQLATAAATGIATAAQWAWNAALTANPIGIIIVAIAALVAGLIWFFTQTELGQQIVQNVTKFIQEAWANVSAFLAPVFERIGQVASEVWNGIMSVVGAVISWFQSNVLPVIQFVINAIVAYFQWYWGIVSTVWNAIMAAVAVVVDWFMAHVYPAIQAFVNFLVALFNYLWQVAVFAWNTMMSAIGQVVGAIISFLTDAWNNFQTGWKILWDIVSSVVSDIWNNIVGFITGVVTGVVNFLVGIWNGFVGAFTAVMNAIWSVVNAIWNQIRGFVEPVVSGIVNFITSTWNGIIGPVRDIFNNVYNAIKEPLDNAIRFISGIKDTIIGFFSNAGSWLFNAGKSIIQGFIDGLEAMFSNVTNFFNNLTNMIPETKGPPARDKVLLTENGELIMKSLINGLQSQTGKLYGMLGGLNEGIPSSLEQNINARFNDPAEGKGQIVLNLKYYAAAGDGTKTKDDVMKMLGHATELVREGLD